MTANSGIITKGTTLALAMALMIGAAGLSALPAGTVTAIPPTNQNYTQNAAAATIKTQAAADNISGGIRGIDVSKYQGTINWPAVAQDNVNFVMIRASIGSEVDELFLRNAKGAHENGLLVGAYHYAKFTNKATMQKEAELFISQLKNVDITYPVALDIEAHRNLSRSALTNLALEFMQILRSAGYTPMIYSYTNFYRDYLDVAAFADYPMWVANYQEQPLAFEHQMWQHTSYGTVKGISGRVDINIAYEDLRVHKRIMVNKVISDSIKETLNVRYNVGLPLDTLDMAQMNAAIANGMHAEINRQLGAELALVGSCDDQTVSWLQTIDFVPESTKGNITYLLQVKLFYKGFYTGDITSVYDSKTINSLERFQSQSGLSVNGLLDFTTLQYLLA